MVFSVLYISYLNNTFYTHRHLLPLYHQPEFYVIGLIRCGWLMFWRRQWQPTPVFLPGESQGRRSLVGCRLWSRTESDTTEWLHFHFSLSRIGAGNGNPLQCSCLENPRDAGAWSRRVGHDWSDLAAAAAGTILNTLGIPIFSYHNIGIITIMPIL